MIFKIVKTELKCNYMINTYAFIIVNAIFFILLYFFSDGVSSKKEFLTLSLLSLFVWQMIGMTFSLARKSNRQYTQFPITSSKIMIANWIGFYLSVIFQIFTAVFFLSLFEMKLEFSDIVNSIGMALYYSISMIIFLTNYIVFSWKNAFKRWECYCLYFFPICGLIFLHLELTNIYGDYIFQERFPIVLIIPLTIICLFFTAGNVWLFNRKDDYLDEEYSLSERT